jgi:hypothetical protein
MLALSTSQSTPLNVQRVAELTANPYQRGPGFGQTPWVSGLGFAGGCGCDPVGGCRCSGLRGGHGGSSHSGMGKSMGIAYGGLRGLRGHAGMPFYGMGRTQGIASPTLRGLGQTPSLDSIIANAVSWLGGFAQSQLPASASIPPQYGSPGAISAQVQAWLPWIIGGYLVYRLVR